MKITTNITNYDQDLNRYGGAEDLHGFCRAFGLDGIELMPGRGMNTLKWIDPKDVVGIHLPYYTDWLDFWRGDEAALMAEYGDWDTVRQVFGGDRPDCILQTFRDSMRFAERIGAEYVVFHVSNITLSECGRYEFVHTDEEVCEAAAEMINRLREEVPLSCPFLMENLWWPGLTMTRPEVTRDLLQAVHGSKKGIMLDTGHVMHTHRGLRSQQEALEYVNHCLDAHGNLCEWIRGVHLHQSVTGDAVQAMLTERHPPQETYWERFRRICTHIIQIDRHEPFEADGTADLVQRIAPDFLTFEFITRNRREHEDALRRQNVALNRGEVSR